MWPSRTDSTRSNPMHDTCTDDPMKLVPVLAQTHGTILRRHMAQFCAGTIMSWPRAMLAIYDHPRLSSTRQWTKLTSQSRWYTQTLVNTSCLVVIPLLSSLHLVYCQLIIQVHADGRYVARMHHNLLAIGRSKLPTSISTSLSSRNINMISLSQQSLADLLGGFAKIGQISLKRMPQSIESKLWFGQSSRANWCTQPASQAIFSRTAFPEQKGTTKLWGEHKLSSIILTLVLFFAKQF